MITTSAGKPSSRLHSEDTACCIMWKGRYIAPNSLEEQQDQLILNWILSSLSPSILPQVASSYDHIGRGLGCSPTNSLIWFGNKTSPSEASTSVHSQGIHVNDRLSEEVQHYERYSGHEWGEIERFSYYSHHPSP